MAAIGCLLPMFLLVAGAAVGGVVGGTTTGLWGGGIGLVLGIVLMVAGLWAFERARDNIPR
jgi:hypothetical protein